MPKKTKVLILAGGKGKRFNPFSFVIPKPLMPINENPILMYLINSFKKYNFREFLISTGYQAELIKAYLGNGNKLGVKIKYCNEKKPLGTAGPIYFIKKEIKNNDYFYLINGDIFTKLNFSKMLNFAKNGNYDLVIGYVKKTYKNNYGIINVEKDQVKKIIEKPSNVFNISSGIYLIKKNNRLNLIPKNKFFTMPQLIQKYLSKNFKVGAYKINDYWVSIENMDNLLKVEKKINKKSK